MKKIIYALFLCFSGIMSAQVVPPTIMSEITPLSSAQMRADALQNAHYLQITFEGETIDWNRTDNVWENLPRPASGLRAIEDVRDAIIGHELDIHVFDPTEQLRFRVALWGKEGLLLEGVMHFQLEQVGDDYIVPEYLAYVQLDLPATVELFVGEALSGKIVVKDSGGNYMQPHFFNVWEGRLRDVPRELLDQAGLLIITREVPPPQGQRGSAYMSFAYDITTGENVEAVHSEMEVQDASLAGWMVLPATELDVMITAYDGIATIPNIQVTPVPYTGWYRLSLMAMNWYWDYNGQKTEIEKPEWVTLRSIDVRADDLKVLPRDGNFWIRLEKDKRYHVIPGHWPTTREHNVPAPQNGGKG